MDARKLIVDQITQDILKGFVCDLARDQEIVITNVRKWADDLYSHIENMQEMTKHSSRESGVKE